MKLTRLVAMGAVTIALALAFVAPVSATDNQKFFVCKYVGTPGEDEELQSGDNPISIAGAQLPQPVVVGTFFTDAHGRSYILAEDVGQDEPDPSECPPPEAPDPTPTPTPEATPTPTPAATPTPVDSVGGATATPTLPPTDTFGGQSSAPGNSWAVLLVVLTGIVASALVLTPHRSRRNR
jgi:hypothetical protein